jgi:hypothetical protein
MRNGEIKIRNLGIEIPIWIDRDITVYTVEAILHSGCDSGAYMPAVTYWDAKQTMSQQGDEITGFLHDHDYSVSIISDDTWGEICVRFLSAAVSLWCANVIDEINDKLSVED